MYRARILTLALALLPLAVASHSVAQSADTNIRFKADASAVPFDAADVEGRFQNLFAPGRQESEHGLISCAIRSALLACVVGRRDAVPVQSAVLAVEGKRLKKNNNVAGVVFFAPRFTVLATLTGFNRIADALLQAANTDTAVPEKKIGKDGQIVVVDGIPGPGQVGYALFGHKVRLGGQLVQIVAARTVVGSTLTSSFFRGIVTPDGKGILVADFGLFKGDNLNDDLAILLARAPGIILDDPKQRPLEDPNGVLD